VQFKSLVSFYPEMFLDSSWQNPNFSSANSSKVVSTIPMLTASLSSKIAPSATNCSHKSLSSEEMARICRSKIRLVKDNEFFLPSVLLQNLSSEDMFLSSLLNDDW